MQRQPCQLLHGLQRLCHVPSIRYNTPQAQLQPRLLLCLPAMQYTPHVEDVPLHKEKAKLRRSCMLSRRRSSQAHQLKQQPKTATKNSIHAAPPPSVVLGRRRMYCSGLTSTAATSQPKVKRTIAGAPPNFPQKESPNKRHSVRLCTCKAPRKYYRTRFKAAAANGNSHTH